MPTVLVSGKKFEITSAQSIFFELDDLGEELKHGCLGGSCSTCKIVVIKGHQNLSTPDPIEKNTLESLGVEPSKVRLSCRAKLLQNEVEIAQE